jgi:hypothetical protein
VNRSGWQSVCTDPACVLGTDGYGATVRVHAEFYGTDAESMRVAYSRATAWANLHIDAKLHLVATTRFWRTEVHFTDVNPELMRTMFGG